MGVGTNCITCHVAHGSNASLSGASASQVMEPDPLAAPCTSTTSRLLRVDNGAACVMCHSN
jgi:hypothetical protein